MDRGHPDDKPVTLESYEAKRPTLPSNAERDKEERPVPPELLARYDEVRFIGEGSMGTVYRAKDPRLGRLVAIKLLKSDDPEDTRRFLREAQAQARVQHENVCRVYEVGEVGGAPYIAMELIEGASLEHAHKEMTLEQKVKVIREVAAALHEAHRLGLIHRDIKPGNIMVVTMDDGSYKPYVVDFGLARDISSTGASTQNGIVGTPAYMSPEQAEGTTALLDRRTDVYSLGATFYDIIAGRTPFIGSNALTLLTQVMYQDAPALGSIRRGVPRQLETIVMTCLQRDPERRYESARALGEDLQRFLDGGTVRAKRPPLTYVLWQKAKRNKALVVVAGIGLCIAVVLGGMWLRAAQQSAKQAELARELGEDVKYVELFLRSAYGMPVHDIEREQRVVRLRLINIERRMEEVGRVGQGPGHYALGRGHLALHEYEDAQKHLELSLASGYIKPEVHYALGLALGERYQAALEDARHIADVKARESAIGNAESTYQRPALQHLRASGGTEVESRTYIEGLVALYEKRYEDAARSAIAAFGEAPWLYEAKKLEGDAHLASGLRESESGHNGEGHRLLDLAADAYGVASAIASSDSAIHEAVAEAWIEILKLQTVEDVSYQHAFAGALSACDNATKANPISAGAFTKKSQAYFHVANHELRSGTDPRTTLQHAIDAGLNAKRIAPDDAISVDMMGNAFMIFAKYEQKVGLSPIPHLQQGITNFDDSTRIQPTFTWAWNDAGIAFRIRAEYETEHGVDPRSSINSGLARLRRAESEDPRYVHAYANITYILAIGATYEFANGHDPRADVKGAVESAIRGAEINPQWLPLLNNRGWAELVAAQYEEATDTNPSTTLDHIEASFQKSLDIYRDNADTHFGLGAAKCVRVLYDIRQGRDPQKHIDEARTFLQKAAELDGQEPNIRQELGQLLLTVARHAIDEKRDPTAALTDAERVVREGLRVNARHAPLHATLAEVLAMRAEYGTRKQTERETLITDGLAAGDESLKHNPKWALAMAAKGTLYAIRAGTKKDAAHVDDNRLAIEWLDKGFAINALLPRRFKTRLEALRGSATPATGHVAKAL